MISEVDDALRALVRTDALDGSTDVDVVLDAPTKDWAARRNAPTVNLYLYDIREDLRRRENGWMERVSNGQVVSRQPIPRYFKLSYLVTAWTQRPEDEHRLLANLMRCFLHYDAMPDELLPTTAVDGRTVRLTVGLPPPEDRAFADVWTALGGELKPSLDVVVIAPMDIGMPRPAGPPVTGGASVSMSDTVHGGEDQGVHKHTAPMPSAAAMERLGIAPPGDAADSGEDGGSGGAAGGSRRGGTTGTSTTAGRDLTLGKGRRPRNQKRD